MAMFGLLLDNTPLPVLGQGMSFTEQRQQVLAANVATIDTPGSRQQDLPVHQFTAALGEAIVRRDTQSPWRFGMQARRDVDVIAGRTRVRQARVDGQTNFYDGADRSVEQLMSEMGKNALWHNLAAELYRQQSQLMQTAIRERIG